LQGEVARLTAVNNELQDSLLSSHSTLAETQGQLAERQQQLRTARSSLENCQDQLRFTRNSLSECQDQLVEVRASLAECQGNVNMLRAELEGSEKARAEMAEQLEHLNAKVRARDCGGLLLVHFKHLMYNNSVECWLVGGSRQPGADLHHVVHVLAA
jgi:chromosome segregation ATPase